VRVTPNLPVMRSEVVRRGHERLRVGPWRGDHRVAFIAPVGDAAPPTSTIVEHACELLARKGYDAALTGALAEREQAGFLAAGFEPREQLHLLTHDLEAIPDAIDRDLRRGWAIHHRSAIDVDASAFPPFWRLDRDGLREAIRATPVARFRIAADDGVVAYAITGRAGARGYVQRLAVRPDSAGHGLGAALVVDGLRWLRSGHADQAVVNTQTDNERALALYERLGFRRQPSGLVVLSRPLGTGRLLHS
jgi:ribosomal protein S18 acetylase RimI-like enzyme